MKKVEVHLKDVKQNFDVRRRLNNDWVVQLALLMEKGTDLPPIELTPDLYIIDGRHRLAAADLANRQVINAVILDNLTPADCLDRAFKANLGGSMPPTQEDIFHTVRRYLDLGLSQRQIIDRLPYPRPVARKYVETAAGSLAQANLRRALQAITDDNLTTAQAAEKFSVPLDKIRAALSGKRKKVRDTATLKGASTSAYNGLSKRNGALLRKLLNEYEDGLIPAKVALDISDHLKHLIRLQLKAVEDWEARLIALSTGKPVEFKSNWTEGRRQKAREAVQKINEKKWGQNAIQ